MGKWCNIRWFAVPFKEVAKVGDVNPEVVVE